MATSHIATAELATLLFLLVNSYGSQLKVIALSHPMQVPCLWHCYKHTTNTLQVHNVMRLLVHSIVLTFGAAGLPSPQGQQYRLCLGLAGTLQQTA
jgi:hypothetical protein